MPDSWSPGRSLRCESEEPAGHTAAAPFLQQGKREPNPVAIAIARQKR